MAGTVAGGHAAAKENKRKYGADFYKRIGSLGGKAGTKDGTVKGFAAMTPEQRSEAGRKGGQNSRRGK